MFAPGSMAQQWKYPQQQDFQAYVPQSPVGYERWGKRLWIEDAQEAYPDIGRTALAPGGRENYNIAQGAGRQLGQNSWPAVSGPAMAAGNIAKMLGPFLDYVGGGKFTPAFNRMERQSLAKQQFALRAQREYLEMERERMMDLNDMAIANFRRDIAPAQEVMDDYHHEVLGKGLANEQEAWNRLHDWALRTGHTKLQHALENGGLRAGESWLNDENAKINDLALANGGLRASDRARAARAGAAGRPEGYSGEDLVEGGGEGDEVRRDAAGRPIAPGLREPKAEAPAPAAPTEEAATPEDVDSQIKKKWGLSDQGMTFARSLSETGKVEGQTPTAFGNAIKTRQGKENWNKVLSGRADLDQRMRNAVRTLGPDDTAYRKLDRLGNVSPVTVDRVKRVGNYGTDPYKEFDQGLREPIISLTRAVYPQYNPKNMGAAEEFTRESKMPFQLMAKLSALGQADASLVDVTKGMSENDVIPGTTLKRWIAGHWSGDPEYGRLGEVLQQMNTSLVAIQTMTGSRPAITLVNAMAERQNEGMSLRQIRHATQAAEIDAFAHFATLQHRWEGFNKEELAPGMDQTGFKFLSDYMRMNADTQQMPADAAIRMARASKEPKEWNTRLSEEQKHPPLTSDQMRRTLSMIQKYRNDTRPEVQAEVRKWMRAIGPVGDGPWNWPQFDQEILPSAPRQ